MTTQKKSQRIRTNVLYKLGHRVYLGDLNDKYALIFWYADVYKNTRSMEIFASSVSHPLAAKTVHAAEELRAALLQREFTALLWEGIPVGYVRRLAARYRAFRTAVGLFLRAVMVSKDARYIMRFKI